MPDDSEKEEFLNVGDVPKLSDIIAQMKSFEDSQNLIGKEVKIKLNTGWNGNDDEIKLLPQDTQPNFLLVTVPEELIADDMSKNKLSEEEKGLLDEVFSKVLKKNKGAIDELVEKVGGLHKLNKNGDLIEPVVDKNNDMWWHPKGGKKVLASQMSTSHLFFSLRLLFNKIVPEEFRIDVKGNAQANVQGDLQIKHAIKVLFHQLAKRDDLTDEQFVKMRYMASILRQHVP